VPSAAALEMLHNAFLVHDDIEDGSERRRDQPAMYVEHGVPLAVNVGDAMQALSLRMLKDNVKVVGPEVAWRIVDEFDHMLMQSLEGQAMELGWVRDNDCSITDDDYLLLVLKKTYSAFSNPNVEALVAALAPSEVIVFGVATDVCNDAAITGLLARGYRVAFVEDASRGLSEERTAAALARWREGGVRFTLSADVVGSP